MIAYKVMGLICVDYVVVKKVINSEAKHLSSIHRLAM